MNSIRSLITKTLPLVLLVSLSAQAMEQSPISVPAEEVVATAQTNPADAKPSLMRRGFNKTVNFVGDHRYTLGVAGIAGAYSDVRNSLIKAGSSTIVPVLSYAATLVKNNQSAAIGAGLGAAAVAVGMFHKPILKKANEFKNYCLDHKAGSAAVVVGSGASYAARNPIANAAKATVNFAKDQFSSAKSVASNAMPSVSMPSVPEISPKGIASGALSGALNFVSEHKFLVGATAAALTYLYGKPVLGYVSQAYKFAKAFAFGKTVEAEVKSIAKDAKSEAKKAKAKAKKLADEATLVELKPVQ